MMFTLDQARRFKGLSQDEVATALGIHRNTYIKCESYQRILDMKQALKFSEITGINLENLIFFEGQVQKFCTTEEVMK